MSDPNGQDLYRILGVRKKASAGSILKAYRKKCLVHHPDRGGDAAEFGKISAAYRILSDPDKRKLYDETGSADDAPNRDIEKTAGIVVPLYLNTIRELMAKGQHPHQTNIIAIMMQANNQIMSDLDKNREDAKCSRGVLEGCAKRMHVPEGEPNFFVGAIDRELKQLDEGLRRMTEELDARTNAKKFLEKCRYDADTMRQMIEFNLVNMTTSASTSW